MSRVHVPTFSIAPASAVLDAPAPGATSRSSSVVTTDSMDVSDRALLSCIFDPHSSGPTSQSSERGEYSPLSDDELGDKSITLSESLLHELRALEAQGVALAHANRLQDAANQFTTLIARCPDFASAFNNRAQVLLLLHQDEDALQDLNDAIRLATAAHDRLTLRQAYTQRAVLRRAHEENELARADFTLAAQLGSSWARSQAVSMNPYAALCNNLLAQAIEQLSKPQVDIDHAHFMQQP